MKVRFRIRIIYDSNFQKFHNGLLQKTQVKTFQLNLFLRLKTHSNKKTGNHISLTPKTVQTRPGRQNPGPCTQILKGPYQSTGQNNNNSIC